MEYQNENFGGQYEFRSRFHDGWHMCANLHEYSELLYCKTGSGWVIVNGRKILLCAGELVWIPPNYIHQYDFDDSQVICAVFSNDFIPLFFKELRKQYFCVSPISIGELASVVEAFPNMQKGDTLQICGYLNLLCAKIMENSHFDGNGQRDGVLYQKVISYISENFREDITLSSLAHAFGYNQKYLSHALHELTGIHFRQLLNLYRIDYAKYLLSNRGEVNISNISAECGFSAVNTFNREFKRIVGVTPREYREN